MKCLLVSFVIASIGVHAQLSDLNSLNTGEEQSSLLGRGHFGQEQSSLGYQQGGIHPYLRRVFLMSFYKDTVDQYTAKINAQKQRTPEAEKTRTELMEKFARQALIIVDLLEDDGSFHFQSSPYGYPSALGGTNPYIKQLIAKKFLEDTTTKYRLEIENEQKNSAPTDVDAAVSKSLKEYANQVFSLRRIFGI